MEYAMVTAFPVTSAIRDWLLHNLQFVEEGAYNYYKGCRHLVRLVDEVEAGRKNRFVANSAILAYNSRYGTAISYEQLKTRSSTHLLASVGELHGYLDSEEAERQFLSSDADTFIDALHEARGYSEWVILHTVNDILLVLRSPYTGRFAQTDGNEDLLHGFTVGDHLGFALPPEIVAATTEQEMERLVCRMK